MKHTKLLPHLTISLLILLTGFATYFTALDNHFVIDDQAQIGSNTSLHSLKNIPQFFLESTFHSGGADKQAGTYYHPLTSTAFALIYQIAHYQVFLYHFIQILLHSLNAYLIFNLFKLYFKPQLSLFLAVIFLIHPLNVESVVYITNLQEPLYLLFGLLAILTVSKKSAALLSHRLTVLLLALSLLTKEAGLIMATLAIITLYILHHPHRRQLTAKITILVSGYLLLRWLAVGGVHIDPAYPMTTTPLLNRLLNISAVLSYYFTNFLWPTNLSIGQVWVITHPTWLNFYLPTLVLVGIVVLYGVCKLKINKQRTTDYRLLTTDYFIIWITISLLPYLQLIPLEQTVADRWFYPAMIGILGLLGSFIQLFPPLTKGSSQSVPPLIEGRLGGVSLINSNKVKPTNLPQVLRGQTAQTKLTALLPYCLTALLIFLTQSRISDWQTGFTLYARDIQKHPTSFTLHNSLGYEYFTRQQYDQAEHHFHRSIELQPHWGMSRNNLAALYEIRYQQTQDPYYIDQAINNYRQAIQHNGGYYPYVNLARILIEHADFDEARLFIRQAIQRLPNNPDLWYLLSKLEYDQGNYNEAHFAAQQLVKLNPTPKLKPGTNKSSTHHPLPLQVCNLNQTLMSANHRQSSFVFNTKADINFWSRLQICSGVRYTTHMNSTIFHLPTALQSYQPLDDRERDMHQRLTNFLKNHPHRCYHNDHFDDGHVTGSAWIVNQDRTHALLTHHRKLDRWFQPGGHSDNQANTLNVATREAHEETGLSSIKLVTQNIFDIDIHLFPANKKVPDHYHYDIRFLFTADMNEPINHQIKESYEIKWIPLEQIKAYNPEPAIARLITKTQQLKLHKA